MVIINENGDDDDDELMMVVFFTAATVAYANSASCLSGTAKSVLAKVW